MVRPVSPTQTFHICSLFAALSRKGRCGNLYPIQTSAVACRPTWAPELPLLRTAVPRTERHALLPFVFPVNQGFKMPLQHRKASSNAWIGGSD
eukprot:s570_g10.t1